jgi:hypothetical protein
MQVFCLAYSWSLKIEAIYSTEMSDGFQRTTERYIPEDRTLHNLQILLKVMFANNDHAIQRRLRHIADPR